MECAIRIDGTLDTDWTLDDDVGDVIGAPGCNDGILLADDERLGNNIGGMRLILLVLDRNGFNTSLWNVTDFRFPALSERIRPTTGRIFGIGGCCLLGIVSEFRRGRVAAFVGPVGFNVGRNMSGSRVN